MIVRGAPTDDPAIREYAEMIVSARDEDSIYLTRAELLPMARAYLAAQHHCQPPTIAGGTSLQQPDWTCGVCGRIWRDCRTMYGTQWWAEVRGPLDRLLDSA